LTGEIDMTRLVLAFRVAATALLVLAFAGAPTSSRADTANVRIEIVKAGFIVGVQGGGGSMRFAGRNYRLGIGGVSLGATIGASKAVLVGRAFNMRRASDIAGTYGKAEAGVAVVTGGKVARLRNEKGVVLEIRGHQVGLEFSLDLSGMVVTLR
jgi:hypothetical protein